jgi:NADPH:quinone reductase-like Zn-dependent oxidoreductase
MMNAVICTRYGPPEVLQLKEVPKPEPKADEVRIRIHAAAATAAGLTGRKGEPRFARLFMGLNQPKRSILGQEIAGVIDQVGQTVSDFKAGDAVFAQTGMTMGAQAEYVCLPESGAIVALPADTNFEESVAVVEGGLTALNFFRRGGLKAGQHVLIYGASGSVGTAAVQIAKAQGAYVTGVCSTANLELVRSLGADELIDYTAGDFTENGKTYDMIFDTVGKRSFGECKASLTPSGTYLDAAGVATVLPMLWTSIVGKKRAIMAATYVRPAAELREDLEIVKTMVESGQLRAVIDRRYPLAQTAEAHAYVETGRKKGNVILTVVPELPG